MPEEVPREVVESLSSELFKTQVDKGLGHFNFEICSSLRKRLDWMTPRGLFFVHSCSVVL